MARKKSQVLERNFNLRYHDRLTGEENVLIISEAHDDSHFLRDAGASSRAMKAKAD